MRELREKWIKGFVSLGPEIEHNGQKVRPNTTTSVVIGKVVRLDEAGKNNLKATIKVPTAKYDFSGFLNDNTPVSNLLKQAKEKDVPICVRIERKRKKNADPTADIADLTKTPELGRENVIWIVAGVFNFSTSEWILTDDAISNPEEDPDYVMKEIKSASYSTSGFFQSDAPRLQTTDKDWKANHLISMFAYASEHNIENEIGLNTEQLKILAIYMLKAVDQLQMKAKGIDVPNYNDYSHTKARGMLFSWMRLNPLSKDIMTQKGAFNQWISRFLEENLEIWNWANAEANKE
mgnify:FL=1